MKARPKSRQSDPAGDGVISVRVQPRASRNSITLQADGSYKIRLTAPPVDGAANEALVKFLSGALGVSRSSVVIESGHTGREKRISFAGLSLEKINRLLNASKE